jgi:hypothetical protein
MHALAMKPLPGEAGTHTCEPEQPPPTEVGAQTRPTSLHCAIGTFMVGLGAQVPFSPVPCTTMAAPAFTHPVLTQKPLALYGRELLAQSSPVQVLFV